MWQGGSTVGRCATASFLIWAAFTAALLATLSFFWMSKGEIPSALFQLGPTTNFRMTHTAVGLVWLSFGVLSFALQFPGFRAAHGWKLACAAAAVVLYANVFRERVEYGDYGDYVQAAINLTSHAPFHQRYLYPPFFAHLLALMLPTTEGEIFFVLWTLNLVSTGIFAFVLCAVLQRYGFGARAAAACVFAFVAINVPMLRTLAYVQVNLIVISCILMALLWYPRWRIASAFVLAVAVHLKVSPVLVAVLFVLGGDWRWALTFGLSLAALAAPTLQEFGTAPFLSSLDNVRKIYLANGQIFRENSIDSLFRSAEMLHWMAGVHTQFLIKIGKGLVLAVGLAAAVRAVLAGAFVPRSDKARVVLNGAPAVLVMMMLLSPLLWEHHPVFVALPFLVVLLRLSSPLEWAAYVFAFFLTFHIPTFDFYPWSFSRLLGPLILLALLLKVSGSRPAGSLSAHLS